MINLFMAYSHKDEGLRDQLEVHLSLMKRQDLIAPWHDRRIPAGAVIDDAIDVHLRTDDVILLLVSADFIASDYIWNIEMKRALERHQNGHAVVVPVILRQCDWHSAPFGKFLAVPKDGVAVEDWPSKDAAFADIAKRLRSLIESMETKAKRGGAAAEKNAKPDAPQSVSRNKVQADAPPAPRSSNLRLKKIFTDADKDRFLDEGYEYIANFFRASLRELEERNEGITFKLTRLDARRFEAAIYRNGKEQARCRIILRGPHGGIAYSGNPQQGDSSANNVLHVQADDQSMFFDSMFGGFGRGDNDDGHLSFEGAGEQLWGQFIERLQ